jgi:hypothetical protein
MGDCAGRQEDRGRQAPPQANDHRVATPDRSAASGGGGGASSQCCQQRLVGWCGRRGERHSELRGREATAATRDTSEAAAAAAAAPKRSQRSGKTVTPQ